MSKTSVSDSSRAPLSKRIESQTVSLKLLSVVATAILLGLIGWLAGGVLLLIFTGLLLATLLVNLRRLVTRFTGLGRGWSLAVVLVSLSILIVLLFILFATRIAAEADELVRTVQSAWQQLVERLRSYEWAQQFYSERQLEQLSNVHGDWLKRVAGVFSTTVGILSSVILVLFIGIFTAADEDLYRRGLLHLVPCNKRQRAGEVLDETASQLWLWTIGQFFSMSMIGLATGVGLWILGIPFAATLGLLAGLLTFIPNFGPILSAVPAILLALTNGPVNALYVILLYLGVQAVESNLLTPLVQQHNVKLPPVLNVGVQVLLGVLFGVAGLIVAAPLTVVGMVLVKRLYVEDYLGDRSVASGADAADRDG